MNCLRCNTSNEEGAKFCKNCGMDMSYTPTKENLNSNQTINQLLILLGFNSFFSIIYLILNFGVMKFDWGYKIYDYVGWALDIISILALLIFAIITKHKNARIFLIVFLILKIITVMGFRVL